MINNNIKTINIKIKLTQMDINMIHYEFNEKYKIYVSPSIVDIIEKMDSRFKYMFDTEEKMIDMFNLLNYSMDNLENEFKIFQNYKIELNIQFKSIETDKEKCIKEKFNLIRKKENNIKLTIRDYKSKIKSLNESIEDINLLKIMDIKKIDLPQIDYKFDNGLTNRQTDLPAFGGVLFPAGGKQQNNCRNRQYTIVCSHLE